MSGYQLRYQIADIYQAYLREGNPEQYTYEQYLQSFYDFHTNTHTAQSKEVRTMFNKDIKKDKIRRRLRQKLQQKREAQVKVAEAEMLKTL